MAQNFANITVREARLETASRMLKYKKAAILDFNAFKNRVIYNLNFILIKLNIDRSTQKSLTSVTYVTQVSGKIDNKTEQNEFSFLF